MRVTNLVLDFLSVFGQAILENTTLLLAQDNRYIFHGHCLTCTDAMIVRFKVFVRALSTTEHKIITSVFVEGSQVSIFSSFS